MARDLDIVSSRGRLVRGALSAWAVVIYVFLFAPIVLLVVFSFNANKYGTFPFTGWTLHWYGQVFGDYQIRDALTTTLKVAFLVTVISTVVGTAAFLAYGLGNLSNGIWKGQPWGMTIKESLDGLLFGLLTAGTFGWLWPKSL